MPVKKTTVKKTVKKAPVKKAAVKSVKKVSKPTVKKTSTVKTVSVPKVIASKTFISPIEAWKSFWKRGFTEWAGTSSRSEYWYSVLVNWLIRAGLILVGIVLFGQIAIAIANLYAIASLIPAISMMNRRLHDAGISSWWWFMMLLLFIPFLNIIFIIILIVVLCQPTSVKNNPYHKFNK